MENLEQAYDLDARILELSRKQLIEEGKIALNEDDCYVLTEKGRKTARKEWERYEHRPNMDLLLQHYILEKYDVPVG